MKSWHKCPIVYQQQCLIGICQNPWSDWKSSTNRNNQVAFYRDNRCRSKFVRCLNKIRGCKKSDSNGDHTKRTSAYCQSQNKHYGKYTSYICKMFEFHSVGLKRTHITVERDLQITSIHNRNREKNKRWCIRQVRLSRCLDDSTSPSQLLCTKEMAK
jgi:hypothetical protein